MGVTLVISPAPPPPRPANNPRLKVPSIDRELGFRESKNNIMCGLLQSDYSAAPTHFCKMASEKSRNKDILLNSVLLCSILFYSILFYYIIFYSILLYYIVFYYILLYFILFYSILIYSIILYSILFYSILFCCILFYFCILKCARHL